MKTVGHWDMKLRLSWSRDRCELFIMRDSFHVHSPQYYHCAALPYAKSPGGCRDVGVQWLGPLPSRAFGSTFHLPVGCRV